MRTDKHATSNSSMRSSTGRKTSRAHGSPLELPFPPGSSAPARQQHRQRSDIGARAAEAGAGWMGRGGIAGQGGLTSWAEAGQIRPVVVALTSCCARCPRADVAEHTTPANRHGRRQDLEKCEEVPHALTLFQVSLSASITRGSSVFHKSLKRGQRAPVAFPVVSHLLPLHQLFCMQSADASRLLF